MTTIAEVLHLAADTFLWPGGVYCSTDDDNVFSCFAIERAAKHLQTRYGPIKIGLRRMGLCTDSANEFNEFPRGTKRQAARYAWLKFAAMIAEEQGV